MKIMHARHEAIVGCILGGAIGDAAASAYEGEMDSSRGWELTDDTQLTLATCEALISAPVDPESVAQCMLRWYRARRITRMGSSTLKALRDLDAGAHWALAGRQGDRAAGNGAAMRIAPLAFCVDAATAPGRQLIRDVCRITHHNDEAYVGALAIVIAIQSPGISPQEIAAELPDSVVRDRLRSRDYGASGYVADSVPLAIFASQKVAEIGFVSMLEQVIAAGGDTDTNASLACQIAGAQLGFSGLPQEYLERLPEREMVLEIATAFARSR